MGFDYFTLAWVSMAVWAQHNSHLRYFTHHHSLMKTFHRVTARSLAAYAGIFCAYAAGFSYIGHFGFLSSFLILQQSISWLNIFLQNLKIQIGFLREVIPQFFPSLIAEIADFIIEFCNGDILSFRLKTCDLLAIKNSIGFPLIFSLFFDKLFVILNPMVMF